MKRLRNLKKELEDEGLSDVEMDEMGYIYATLKGNTKSVRAFISGAPEWVSCTLIETHTTGKGADGDDAAIIEDLHNKVLKQATEIEKLRDEKKELNERISKNHFGELLDAVNQIQQGLIIKKAKTEYFVLFPLH